MWVSSWMCHTSWGHAILANSAWSSSWPAGWIQPLCEVSTWPIAFSLQRQGTDAPSANAASSTCPLWGDEWQVGRGVQQGRQVCGGHQHPCLAPTAAATGPATARLCAQLYASASPAHSCACFCVREKLLPLTNRTKVCCCTNRGKCKACLLLIDLLYNQHVENYFCFTLKSSARHFLYYSFWVIWTC